LELRRQRPQDVRRVPEINVIVHGDDVLDALDGHSAHLAHPGGPDLRGHFDVHGRDAGEGRAKRDVTKDVEAKKNVP